MVQLENLFLNLEFKKIIPFITTLVQMFFDILNVNQRLVSQDTISCSTGQDI